MASISILIENEFFKEIFLAIIIFAVSILLAVNEDEIKDKQYQKKYILTVYLVVYLYFTFLKPNNHFDDIFLIIPLVFIIFLGGINLSYKSDLLEKELGRLNLLTYKSFEWFIITRSYLFFICVLFLIMTNGLHSYNWKLLLITIPIFLSYHLLSNIIDTFGVKNFEEVKRSLNKYIEEFDMELSDLKSYDYEFLIECLSFVVYMEDKDYFERKGTVFNPYYVIRRKINRNYPRVKSIVSKTRKKILLRRVFQRIKQLNFKLIIKAIKYIHKYVRGYSTLEQQIIRTLAMEPDSYRYTYRRKIFVEFIYNIMFFRAIRKQKKRYREIYYLTEMEVIKISLLKFYYNYILESPKNLNVLFTKLAEQSRVSISCYKHIYYDYFTYSTESIMFKSIIRRGLLVVNKILYDSKNYKIYHVKDNIKTLLIDGISSRPISSPNGRYIAFINPFGWECMSNIYVMDLCTRNLLKVYEWKYSLCPKYIQWETDETILIILGETYGTIEIGGNLYRLNIENKELEIVKEFEKDIQITEFTIDEDIITVSGIKYTNNENFSHIPYKESFKYQ